MDDIGNIKTLKGNWFKVFWDKLSRRVFFKTDTDNVDHIAPMARSEYEAKKNAKDEANKIERMGEM